MKRLLILILPLFMLACAAGPLVSSQPLPTPIPPDALATIIAATGQASWAMTETARPLPTPTVPSPTPPPPTPTRTATPTATATFVIIIPSPTASNTPLPPPPSYGGGGSGGGSTPIPTAVGKNFCSLLEAYPSGSAAVRPGGDFDAVWVLKNISERPWDNTSIDVVFLEGERMQKNDKDFFDLPEYVKPGQTMELRIDMRAPFVAGTYTAIWGFRQGHDIVCKFSVTVKADGTPYPTFTPTITPTATVTATPTP